LDDVHGWVQPLRIAALRLIEFLDLLLENGENAASRIAAFEPVGERVYEKIVLSALFVCFQCIIENLLEVGRCGSRVSVRHEGEARSQGEDSRVVGNGEREEGHASQTCRISLCITDRRHAVDRRARHMATAQPPPAWPGKTPKNGLIK
jgi:hypothetical protein